jgi:hypothetical protein
MDKFIGDIIEKLEGVNNGSNVTNKQWTIALKKALIDVAEKYNLSTCCNLYKEQYKNNDNTEWVYDIIIYSWENGVFGEVYLAGESEWNSDYESIEYDFLKLIFSRSKVRLMIYQVSENDFDEYKNKLINIIEKSSSCLKGDIYLFGIYNKTTDAFTIEKYIKSDS